MHILVQTAHLLFHFLHPFHTCIIASYGLLIAASNFSIIQIVRQKTSLFEYLFRQNYHLILDRIMCI